MLDPWDDVASLRPAALGSVSAYGHLKVFAETNDYALHAIGQLQHRRIPLDEQAGQLYANQLKRNR